jgi:hypothetical protein
MTSGKTTLSRSLVKEGAFDIAVEVDDFVDWVSGESNRLGSLWNDNPKRAKEITKQKCVVAGRVIGHLSKYYHVVASGVWPGEYSYIVQSLQDYSVAVINYFDIHTARERWIARSCEPMTRECIRVKGEDFDTAPWGKEPYWEHMYEEMHKFVVKMEKKGKLEYSIDVPNSEYKWNFMTPETKYLDVQSNEDEAKED